MTVLLEGAFPVEGPGIRAGEHRLGQGTGVVDTDLLLFRGEGPGPGGDALRRAANGRAGAARDWLFFHGFL
ncbi:MAG: hypothetical protein ACRDV9_02715, partial [Acidimicrobiia bacterium]